MKSSLMCAIVLITVMGCSATRPLLTETPTADQATLYVYRPSDTMVLNWPYVYINGIEFGELKEGGYIRALVSSGDITVEIKNGGNPFKRYMWYWPGPAVKFSFSATSGNIYYARFSPEVNVFSSTSYVTSSYSHVLNIVSNDVGSLDIILLDAKYK